MDFKDLYNFVHDDFKWFDEWANPVNRTPSGRTRSFELINMDDYTILPRKSFVERQIKEKEGYLQELKNQKTNYLHRFEEQERSLLAEIGNLQTQLKKQIEKP